ncbi:hypothetical protein ACKWTF_012939 [Chironomus riparius]
MRKILFLASCLMSILRITTSVEISCSYSVQNYYILWKIYSCVISTVTSSENEFADIVGTHTTGKTHNDVLGLYGTTGNIEKFPKGLERFRNLKVVYLYNGQIKELRSDDLQYLPELVELYFDNNKIEVIEDGTFKFNLKLVAISFKNNRVYHISANVFDHLTSLTYLWLNGNICPNSVARNDRNGVLSLIATAKSSCQSPAFVRLEKKLKSSSKVAVPTGKCIDSNEIFANFSTKLLDLKGHCLHRGNQAMEKINDFELDYGNMQSEFIQTLNNKFDILKTSLNNCE